MKRAVALGFALTFLAGCTRETAEQKKRAEIKKLGPQTIQVLAAEGQLPYCLVYTFSAQSKVTRQLTMNRYNESMDCPPGKPIGNRTYRIPVAEGTIKVLVFFSDQRLNAGSIADQIMATGAENPNFRPMDLRLPGRVITETLEFTPEPALEVVMGSEVGGDGGTSMAADAGAATTGMRPDEKKADAGTP